MIDVHGLIPEGTATHRRSRQPELREAHNIPSIKEASITMADRSYKNPFIASHFRKLEEARKARETEPSSEPMSPRPQRSKDKDDLDHDIPPPPSRRATAPMPDRSAHRDNADRYRRTTKPDGPVIRRNIRITDTQWAKLEQIGRSLLPKEKAEGRYSREGKPVAYSYALDLLLDHVSEVEIRAYQEARRMTSRKRRGGRA